MSSSPAGAAGYDPLRWEGDIKFLDGYIEVKFADKSGVKDTYTITLQGEKLLEQNLAQIRAIIDCTLTVLNEKRIFTPTFQSADIRLEQREIAAKYTDKPKPVITRITESDCKNNPNLNRAFDFLKTVGKTTTVASERFSHPQAEKQEKFEREGKLSDSEMHGKYETDRKLDWEGIKEKEKSKAALHSTRPSTLSEEVLRMKQGTEVISFNPMWHRPRSPGYKTKFTIEQTDTFQAAERLRGKNYKVAALNFANAEGPGGAQEGDLMKRSNYLLSLDVNDQDLLKQMGGKYNIPDDGCIYSPGVIVDKKFTVNMIAAAAPIFNEKYVEERFKIKMRAIFRTAIDKGDEALVLGAWGCGVFGNQPENVAKWFYEVLQEYQGYFKEIVFAIPDDKNLRPFQAQFKAS